MKKTKTRPPYHDDGRTRFPQRGAPGAYLIYKESWMGAHALRYVGYSGTDVYKALYRHFQTWNDDREQYRPGAGKRKRVTYPKGGYLVRVVYCRTGAEAQALETALILKHRPPDNLDKFEGYQLNAYADSLLKKEGNAAYLRRDEEDPF